MVTLGHLAAHQQDEFDRLQLQAEVKRMSRALKVLSETSRVLHSAKSETELFDDVCRLSVALGYRLAWVGMARHDDERTVEPVARAGYHDRYLDEVRLTWGDDIEDEGPTGAAIRSGEMVIARDILADKTQLTHTLSNHRRDVVVSHQQQINRHRFAVTKQFVAADAKLHAAFAQQVLR